jgi:peptidoglycan/LPS O-acetylase OafA/YrhL
VATPAFFGSHLPAQLVFYAVGIGLSLAVAWLSWQVYENPILRLKRFFPSDRISERTGVRTVPAPAPEASGAGRKAA